MSEPIARTVKDFCRTYGIGRTLAYELILDGTLKAVKAGARTLILEESARSWLNNLPDSTSEVVRRNPRLYPHLKRG